MAQALLDKVSKNFGQTQVLHDINLSIADGEFMIFVGPSGSGKSTLLRILAGLESVTTGSIHMGDRDVTQKTPRERNVSMVFQNYALYPHMSVEKNITFGMRVRGEDKAEQKKSLQRVITMLQLDGLLDRKPRQLSGGQKQRVAMARAIVHVPEIFLMDEPLSNLDAQLRNDVRLSIMELQKKLGCTMVYVTHDQIEAMTMADRVAVLNHGKIQQVGTPQELYHRPANQFTAGFIGTPSMNFIPLQCRDGSVFLAGGDRLSLSPELNMKLVSVKDVVLGIRPEHVHPLNGSFCDEQQMKVTSIVKSYEMLGSEFLIHTGEGNYQLKFRQNNDGDTPQIGREVQLVFAMAAVHLFDGSTGQRLN
jgi:sn-glycerol 3-phosphate transport system ATP-binding protein